MILLDKIMFNKMRWCPICLEIIREEEDGEENTEEIKIIIIIIIKITFNIIIIIITIKTINIEICKDKSYYFH